MASIFPGLCADFPVTPFRLFMGTLPAKKIEHQFQTQFQPVYAWLSSRKRVKEQASEYLELDLASCDTELLLRYCEIPFIRRFVFSELVDKQLTLVETGKAAPLPDSGLLQCIEDCMKLLSPRVDAEIQQLQTLVSSKAAGQTEPGNRNVEPYDLLHLIYKAEINLCSGIPDAEMQARAFLCRQHVEECLSTLFKDLGSAESGTPTPMIVPRVDKKEQKLLQRQIPPDTTRIGSVAKWRPSDVTTYYRFMGQKVAAGRSFFTQALYGHTFRKIATNPLYLQQLSLNWARYTGLDPAAEPLVMSDELSKAVCAQQLLFPALKLKAQYLYTSPDVARRQWRTDRTLIPLFRLFPLLGKPAAEDLAAQLVVEAIWKRVPQLEEGSPANQNVLRELKRQVEAQSALHDKQSEELNKTIMEGVHALSSEGEHPKEESEH